MYVAVLVEIIISLFSVCQVLNAGVTAIVDFTYSPWAEIKELTSDLRIPYYRVDITKNVYLDAFEKYLQQRNAIDAALIFENEKGKQVLLFKFCSVKLVNFINVKAYSKKSFQMHIELEDVFCV